MRGQEPMTRPHPWRRRVVLASWLACSLVITLRAGQIQVVQSHDWNQAAANQHRGAEVMPAPRGTIKSRDEAPLSVTRERVRVHLAPKEVGDAEATQARLMASLGISASRAERYVTRGSGWNTVGLYPLAVRDSLRGVAGVHLESVFQRHYPHGDVARGVIGVVIDDEGRGGVEQVFEGLLQGEPGSQVVARDSRGMPIPGEQVTVEAPRAGGEVLLTLDMDLQAIAQTALLEAIEENDALGGDVLITDPYSGDILALFSSQAGQAAALSAVNTPFEPGSTLKPFTVAGLLSHGLASLSDTVDVGDGEWEVAGRTLHDTHTEGLMTIRTALSESSNVGIAKAAQAMSEGLQYENLRDFGFGALTGIELPGEVAGTLRRPERWTAQSPASLAIGYEMSVTPLQMAMAYGAIANGGLLMRPRLVSEVRDADGTVLERFEEEAIRRVVDESTARSIGRALVDVVEGGTGTRAQIGTYHVAGKSGTARFSSEGGYAAGDYTSSFVGYFPAEDPQLVIFVKLDRPRGADYYGGAIAAPVTRKTMEAALAANVLNLGRLANASNRPVVEVPTDLYTTFASIRPDMALPPTGLDLPQTSSEAADDAAGTVTVPDVSGLPARSAMRQLHRFGLRASQVGTGDVLRTIPAAGARVAPGDVIRLRYSGQPDD